MWLRVPQAAGGSGPEILLTGRAKNADPEKI